MKYNKIMLPALATVAVAISFAFGVANNKSYANTSDVTIANIEAFTTARGLDCEYKRIDEDCEVTISAGADLKLFGGKIVAADGKGTFIISGKLICESGGDFTCRPIECIDLYELIASGEDL